MSWLEQFKAEHGTSRIWCGIATKHEPHPWGLWRQHFCDGKRSEATSRSYWQPLPPFGRP